MLSLFLMGFMNLVTWWKTCCLILLIVIFFSYSNWTPLRTADCLCQQRNTTGKSYLQYYFLLNVYVLCITARGQDNQFGKLLKTLNNCIILLICIVLFLWCWGWKPGFHTCQTSTMDQIISLALNAYTNCQKCMLYLQLNAIKPKDYNITQTSSPVGLYIPLIIKKVLKIQQYQRN